MRNQAVSWLIVQYALLLSQIWAPSSAYSSPCESLKQAVAFLAPKFTPYRYTNKFGPSIGVEIEAVITDGSSREDIARAAKRYLQKLADKGYKMGASLF